MLKQNELFDPSEIINLKKVTPDILTLWVLLRILHLMANLYQTQKQIVQIFMTIQIVTRELRIVEDKDGSDVERPDFDADDTKTEIVQ